MQVHRTKVQTALALLIAAGALLACHDKSQPDLVANITAELQDSLTLARGRLSDQTMQASMFVNEINKELAKARTLSKPGKELEVNSGIAEINSERNDAIGRITQLVEQLRATRGRIAGLRKEISDKDTVLAQKTLEFEQTLATATQAAEAQRLALQAAIDEKAAKVTALTRQVDSLTRTIHSVYLVVGTKEELVKKGVLVPEGRKRYFVAGPRPLVPARTLDPSAFTRIDKYSDTTIVLPDGVYKIVTRQPTRNAVVSGAFTIEQPDAFWSTSQFLILMRT